MSDAGQKSSSRTSLYNNRNNSGGLLFVSWIPLTLPALRLVAGNETLDLYRCADLKCQCSSVGPFQVRHDVLPLKDNKGNESRHFHLSHSVSHVGDCANPSPSTTSMASQLSTKCDLIHLNPARAVNGLLLFKCQTASCATYQSNSSITSRRSSSIPVDNDRWIRRLFHVGGPKIKVAH